MESADSVELPQNHIYSISDDVAEDRFKNEGDVHTQDRKRQVRNKCMYWYLVADLVELDFAILEWQLPINVEKKLLGLFISM